MDKEVDKFNAIANELFFDNNYASQIFSTIVASKEIDKLEQAKRALMEIVINHEIIAPEHYNDIFLYLDKVLQLVYWIGYQDGSKDGH